LIVQKIIDEKQTIDPQVEMKQCKQELNWNIFNKICLTDNQNELHFFFFWRIMIPISLDSTVMFLSLWFFILIIQIHLYFKKKIN